MQKCVRIEAKRCGVRAVLLNGSAHESSGNSGKDATGQRMGGSNAAAIYKSGQACKDLIFYAETGGSCFCSRIERTDLQVSQCQKKSSHTAYRLKVPVSNAVYKDLTENDCKNFAKEIGQSSTSILESSIYPPGCHKTAAGVVVYNKIQFDTLQHKYTVTTTSFSNPNNIAIDGVYIQQSGLRNGKKFWKAETIFQKCICC